MSYKVGSNPYDENPNYMDPSTGPQSGSLGDRRLSLNALMLSAPSANALFQKELQSGRDTVTPNSEAGRQPAVQSPERWKQDNARLTLEDQPHSHPHMQRLETIKEIQQSSTLPEPSKKYRQGVLIFVFLVIFLINTLINIDHGVIPAATNPIKEDLNIENSQLGLLGSVVYFGLTLGSFVAPPLIKYTPPKILIIVSLTFEMICLILFTFTKKFSVLMISRGGVGFFQVFMVIYFPVWVDLFSPPRFQTLWMTLLQVAVPMGVTVGYVMTAVIIQYTDWRWAFWIQTFIFAACFVLVLFTSKHYLDSENLSEAMNMRLQGKKKRKKKNRRLSRSNTNIISRHRLNSFDTDEDNFRVRGASLYEKHNPISPHKLSLISNQQGEGDDSSKQENSPPHYGIHSEPQQRRPRNTLPVMEHHSKADSSSGGSKKHKQVIQVARAGRRKTGDETPHYVGATSESDQHRRSSLTIPLLARYAHQVQDEPSFKKIFCNPIFTFTMLSISCLYFVITGIQFWITDYMLQVVKLPQNVVYTSFGIISITATLAGVIVGGISIHRLGGYADPRAFNLCLVMAYAAGIVAAPIPYIKNAALLGILLSLLLFCGAFIMPSLTGKMISCVPKHHRAYANSMGAIFLNLLGYLPAPFLYGLVVQLTSPTGEKSNSGMIMLMTWILIGAFLLSLAVIAQHRIWCYREKKERKSQMYRYSTALQDEDHMLPPHNGRGSLIDNTAVINESAGEEGDDSARNPLVPDSGSTEQKAVNEALDSERDYYNEQRALIMAKRHSLVPPSAVEMGHMRRTNSDESPHLRIQNLREESSYSEQEDEEEDEEDTTKHLAGIMGASVLNQY